MRLSIPGTVLLAVVISIMVIFAFFYSSYRSQTDGLPYEARDKITGQKVIVHGIAPGGWRITRVVTVHLPVRGKTATFTSVEVRGRWELDGVR